MSAPNFSMRHNSSFIYGFCHHSDFEEYVEQNKELWDINTEEELEAAKQNECIYSGWYNDEKEHYLDWLQEEINKLTGNGSELYSDFTESLACHITDGDEVATVRKYIQFAGGEFMVMASINFEAGYYEGFALDWNIKSIEGMGNYSSFDYMPDRADCIDLLADNTCLNEGLCSALASKLQKRLQDAMDEVTTAIEEALKIVCPYHLTGACLSNGEGIYTNHKKSV